LLKILELEVPEEKLHDWMAEIGKFTQSSTRQEPDHYPLIRVRLTSVTQEQKFVAFIRDKLSTGELDKDFKILTPAEESN
jgi:hypothetical protein